MLRPTNNVHGENKFPMVCCRNRVAKYVKIYTVDVLKKENLKSIKSDLMEV